ncbi:MAG: KEOPS complex subunit Cgi121 [Thaumarchaeota archaeon]|nr:KEOPS complex subunit Cgi121 [Nitrososphaerota archaeon]
MKVKLFGILKKFFRSTELFIDNVDDIQSLLTYLQRISNNRKSELDLDNIIIAINDIDSNVLNGRHTKLNNDDVVSIIPIIHGGNDDCEERIKFIINNQVVELMEINKNFPFDLDYLREKFHEIALQGINSKYILSKNHAKKIISVSMFAQQHNLMLAKELPTDIIMRFACTNQISKAIKTAGIKKNKNFFIISIGDTKYIDLLYHYLKPFVSMPFLIDYSSFVMDAFNISQLALSSVHSKSQLEDLLVELAVVLF